VSRGSYRPRAGSRPAADSLEGTVRRTVLPDGLRILTEAISTVRSVTFGVWVAVGSRDESPELAGASHFLEHLLFKGTRRRTALDISAQIEAVGGETNAFTTKEYTCYYARVLDTDLALAIDVICDLVTSSLIAPADVETERGVICEEIAMNEDEPAEVAHELFNRAVFGDHPLGRPIAGTIDSISALTRDQIANFYRHHYRAPSMVVTAAGNVDHDAVVNLVNEAFNHGVAERPAATPVALRDSRPRVPWSAKSLVETRETEQAHLIVGCGAPDRLDERRFALGVLNSALGGGMSSRLFQEIREKRGLAYSVYSYTNQYADGGLFAVYAGCSPGKVDEVYALTRAQLARVAEQGLSREEINRGKGMLKGSLVLGLEDTGSRMSRLGKGELLYGDLMPVDVLLERIDAVTLDEVNTLAAELLSRPMSVAAVGPFEDRDIREWM